jgi:hypothetical protein
MNEEIPPADANAGNAGPSPAAPKLEMPNRPAAVAGEPTVPSLKECVEAVAPGDATGLKESGLKAIGALPALLQKACPELAGILGSSAVTTNLRTYERQDAESIRQQSELMREADRANLCLLAAGVTSGVILALSGKLSDAASGSQIQTLTLALGLLTLVFGAAAAFYGYIARDQGRIVRWQAYRGEAEIARLAVFTTTAERAAEAGPKAALYGLAVVVRHLLTDQRDWLGARALRHRKSSEATSRWGGLATALTFIGGSGAIATGLAQGSFWTIWIVLAGVVGAALGAYSANRGALLRDRANADRYEKTQVALDQLAGRTDEVANTIANGEPKALTAYTDAITDLLSTEHKQWLEGTAQAEAALAKLDDQLDQLSKAAKSGDKT